jgi:hypothetical protein
MIQGARYERQGGQHFAINLEEMERCQKHLPAGAPRHVNPFIYDHIRTHGDHVHWAGSKGPHAANARSDAVGGGHAHAGAMIYLGDSWPSEYRDRLFIGNIHGQRLNVDIPVRQGSGYVGKHAPDFLNFNDTWSQSLNQLYDQDGSVFIIDWYDKNQCHHNREDGHDRSNGRIYKIVYHNQPVTHPNLRALPVEELVKLQFHRNDWQVRHARRLLMERYHPGAGITPPPTSALEPLRTALRERTDTPSRLRALWALHVTGQLPETQALALLADRDEFVRAWSIQLLCESRRPSDATLAALERLARQDASPLVRLYLASALQRTPVPQRRPILEPLLARADDARDPNLPLMYWFALEPVVGADPQGGLELLAKTQIPTLRQFITRRLASEALMATR